MKFLHLSDLHIHSTDKEDNRNARKIMEYIAGNYNKDVWVLITGDIVDDGYVEQYENAKRLIKILTDKNMAVLPVPGNHDYGRWGNNYDEQAEARYRESIMDEDYPYVRECDNGEHKVVFIGINSVAGSTIRGSADWARGEAGVDQREALDDKLKPYDNTDDVKVAFLHHHPFYRSPFSAMDDAKQVMDILAARVNILCFGHKHQRDYWAPRREITRVLASGKTTSVNNRGNLEFREIIVRPDKKIFVKLIQVYLQ